MSKKKKNGGTPKTRRALELAASLNELEARRDELQAIKDRTDEQRAELEAIGPHIAQVRELLEHNADGGHAHSRRQFRRFLGIG